MPIGAAFRARDLQEKNNASFILSKNYRQMALSSVSSHIDKNKYVRKAWVEGETLRWRTTYSIMQKTRSGRLHKATSTRTDTCGEAAGVAQALPSRTSCRGVCVTCLPRDDGHTIAIRHRVLIRRLAFFGRHERGAIKVFGACTSRTFLNLLVDPTSAHGS